ncbi:peptide chain release factor N(5)-glutamine methyltransferase [Sphingomonas sp.]|uniref:peptide chain release factor N(5)-glutamine methyltransferase n=1 Tax=Sphingomonas sp. TaxID=28214 RepID=UPI003B3A1A2F
MNVAQTLQQAARDLAGVSDTPRLDAELLLAHAMGISREALLLGPPDATVPEAFRDLVARRLKDEPVAYIVGHRAFWTIELLVTPAVLIPRPDSETLIEAAIAHFGTRAPQRILDLGTGSGALLLAALDHWPQAQGLGIDQSVAALAVARANADRLGLAPRARFAEAGWETAADGGYDLVLCNPPYIEAGAELPAQVVGHEPPSALFAGADGLEDYRHIAPALALPPDGVACIEIGATQARAVRGLFEAEGFLTHVKRDLAGHDRCVVVTNIG